MRAIDKPMLDLLSTLMKLPVLKDYYLAGGTNLALRYDHRTSIDLDLFVQNEFDLGRNNVLNKELKDTFSEKFESLSVTNVGVFGFINNIKVDFINYPYPLLYRCDIMGGGRLAHPLDIAAMKINAIVGRGSRKDFFDLHQLLKHYSLVEIMHVYQKKYGLDNTEQAKMALAFFGDAEDGKLRDNHFLPIDETPWERIKSELIAHYKKLDSDRIISMALKFYKENEYKDGTLASAFVSEYGIRLTTAQLKEVDKLIFDKSKKNTGSS